MRDRLQLCVSSDGGEKMSTWDLVNSPTRS